MCVPVLYRNKVQRYSSVQLRSMLVMIYYKFVEPLNAATSREEYKINNRLHKAVHELRMVDAVPFRSICPTPRHSVYVLTLIGAFRRFSHTDLNVLA